MDLVDCLWIGLNEFVQVDGIVGLGIEVGFCVEGLQWDIYLFDQMAYLLEIVVFVNGVVL